MDLVFPPKSYISITIQTFPILQQPKRGNKNRHHLYERRPHPLSFDDINLNERARAGAHAHTSRLSDIKERAAGWQDLSDKMNLLWTAARGPLIHRSSGERRRSTMLMKERRRRRRQAYLVIRPVGSLGEKKGMNHSPSSSPARASSALLVISAPSRRRKIKVRAHSEAPLGGEAPYRGTWLNIEQYQSPSIKYSIHIHVYVCYIVMQNAI